jgi:hypothetical protein
MNITQITVATHYTYNIGNYSNIRPEVQMTATLETQDTVDEVVSELRRMTLAACQQQIDDVLEKNGEPAKFSTQPRFDAFLFGIEKMAFIVPHGHPCPYGLPSWQSRYNRRLSHLVSIIQKDYPGFTFYDHDFPELRQVFEKQVNNILFIGTEPDARRTLPEFFNLAYRVKTNTRIRDRFFTDMAARAVLENLHLINLDDYIGDNGTVDDSLFDDPDIQALKAAWEAEHAPRPEDDEEEDEDDPFDSDDDDE